MTEHVAVTVRRLRPEDRLRWQSLWQGYLDFYRSELDNGVTDAVFEALVGPDPAVEGLVAITTGDGPDDADTMIGFAHCVIHPNTWSVRSDTYLEDLFVTPAARGTGIGRALIQAILDRGTTRGHRRVHWLTEADNARARRLYDQIADLSGYVRYVVDLPESAAPTDRNGPAVGVFCSSARGLDRSWHDVAEQLGTLVGDAGLRLVYGGTDTGLMATVAAAAKQAGAHVTGVTLQQFVDDRFDHDHCDELVVTGDLFDRKRQLVVRSNGFVALPGGFGTLDEIGDVLAGARLRLHHKPLVLLNHAGFWTPLLASFELMAHAGFAQATEVVAYQVADTPETALAHLEAQWQEAAEPKPGLVI